MFKLSKNFNLFSLSTQSLPQGYIPTYIGQLLLEVKYESATMKPITGKKWRDEEGSQPKDIPIPPHSN